MVSACVAALVLQDELALNGVALVRLETVQAHATQSYADVGALSNAATVRSESDPVDCVLYDTRGRVDGLSVLPALLVVLEEEVYGLILFIFKLLVGYFLTRFK